MAITIDKRVFAQFPGDEDWSEHAMTVYAKGVEHRDEEDRDTPHWAHYEVLADGRAEFYVDCQRMIGSRRSKVLGPVSA